MNIAKRRIPLPWANENEALEKIKQAKTLTFWEASRSWNGQGASLTVVDALKKTKKVLDDLDPKRPLAVQTAKLRDSIVEHGSKSIMKRQLKKVGANTNEVAKTIIL